MYITKNISNLDSVFLGTKIASQEIMKRSANSSISGSIINMSSVAGIVGTPDLSSYNASKGAVRLLTKSNAMDFVSEITPPLLVL